MYGVCAQVNSVGVAKVNLGLTAEGGDGGERGRFSLRVDEVCRISLHRTSLISIRLQPHIRAETGPSMCD